MKFQYLLAMDQRLKETEGGVGSKQVWDTPLLHTPQLQRGRECPSFDPWWLPTSECADTHKGKCYEHHRPSPGLTMTCPLLAFLVLDTGPSL